MCGCLEKSVPRIQHGHYCERFFLNPISFASRRNVKMMYAYDLSTYVLPSGFLGVICVTTIFRTGVAAAKQTWRKCMPHLFQAIRGNQQSRGKTNMGERCTPQPLDAFRGNIIRIYSNV